jgi:antitoxin component YwqK of YwqJK toxin-antitoxin module
MRNYILLSLLITVSIISCKTKQNGFDSKDRHHGKWKYYYDMEGTRLSGKGRFRHGQQVGRWNYYTYDGQVERKERKKLFSDILVTTFYYPSGKVSHRGHSRLLINDEGVHYYWFGEWKYYDEKGIHTRSAYYEDGKLQKTVLITGSPSKK